MESDDVDYAAIEILREILADEGRYGDNCEDPEQFENIIASDEEGSDFNDEAADRATHSYLDLDEIELDKNAPLPKMCRALGSEYYDLLYITERQLQMLLDKCRSKIKDLQDRIDAARNQTSVSRSNWYYMFGMPYFKDRRYFPCPSNVDHLRKLANKELSIIDLPPLRQWKTSHKIKLEDAIKCEEIERIIKDAKCTGRSQNDVDCAKKKTLAELVGFRKSEYDWMKISVQVMENYYSPEECRAMWYNYLHPMIKKTKWDVEEDEKLVELVNLHKNQNWDAIAEQLGTYRSGYQCMVQYQTRLNDKLKKSKWTKEEDDYLREVVDTCRVGSYIPWAKVTSYMDGRSKNQVFNRWAYSLDPNIKRGRFTEEEDILVVAAVRRYGTDDFKRVARFLPGRTSIQVRDRYNSYLKFQSTGECWTPCDDSALLELVKKYGEGNWSKISNHFHNRSRTQVRHRYATIQSWLKKKQVPDGQISVPTRKLNIQDNREEKVWGRVQSILRDMKSSLEMNECNLMKLKEKLNLEQRKRRGRKIGQKKVISKLEKEYYSFFRCVYTQFGGRRKQYFDEEVTQNITQAVQVMLQHFQAQIDIPKSNYAIQEDHVLDESDKVILRSLRDGKKLSIEGINKKESGSMSSVEDCNILSERLSFQSISSTAVAQTSSSSETLRMCPGSSVTNVFVEKTFGSCGENLSQLKIGTENTAINNTISNFQTSSIAIVTESSSSGGVITNSLGMNEKQFLSTPTANNTLRNSFRTYGKQSSDAVSSNMTTAMFRTYGKQSYGVVVNRKETENKSVALNSSVSDKTVNIPGICTSDQTFTHSSGTVEIFPKNVIMNNTATCSSGLNNTSNSIRIPYLCPPNHTTLVGFRTLLLSRRNIAANAMFELNGAPFHFSDLEDLEDGSSSECITPRNAALLWKERFFSLFVWPAVMSNIVPLMMDQVFKTECGVDPYTDCEVKPSTSNSVAEKVKKTKTGKKRKYYFKKKEVKNTPPEKKRKYEKSGKFKRKELIQVEPRRSERCILNSKNSEADS